MSYYIKINHPKNHNSKINDHKAIISNNKCMSKCQKSTCLKWTNERFGHDYRVATVSTLHLSVSGIITPTLSSIGQF